MYVKESQRIDLMAAMVFAAAFVTACVPSRTRLAEPSPAAATAHAAERESRPPTAGHASPAPANGSSLADYLRERSLMVPVHGVAPSQLSDDFSAPRGSRRHNALDILAPRGTPVLSADDGTIRSMRRNSAGGLIIYVIDRAERLIYYYAHLDGYRSGLREGQRVRKGDVLGYVGTTGNAPENTPHLHFQAMRYDDPRRYWEGTPINPFGYFAEEGRKRED